MKRTITPGGNTMKKLIISAALASGAVLALAAPTSAQAISRGHAVEYHVMVVGCDRWPVDVYDSASYRRAQSVYIADVWQMVTYDIAARRVSLRVTAAPTPALGSVHDASGCQS
jgi:hypothetical protein